MPASPLLRHALRHRFGELYRIRDTTLLARLDDYEGGNTEYMRVRVNVVQAERKRVPAWIYLYNRPVDGLRRIRSGDYLAHK